MNAATNATMNTIQKRNKGSLVLCLYFRFRLLSEQGIRYFIQTYVINYFEHKRSLLFAHQSSNTFWTLLSLSRTQQNRLCKG